MSATLKRLLATTALVAGIVGTWAATQWTGSYYGHDPRLGGVDIAAALPWAAQDRYVVYAPIQIFGWVQNAIRPWPRPFAIGVVGAGASSLLFLAGFAWLLVLSWQRAGADRQPAFGALAWATAGDAAAAGLIMGKGRAPVESPQIVALGRMDETLLTVTDGRHVAAFGPSGAGKTRGVIIPTMLAWGGSCLCYTAGKLDVWDVTSGFRAGFGEVRLLDLGDPGGWRFNPLAEVRLGTGHEIDDCLLIAGQFPPIAIGQAREPFWDIEGSRLLSAVILDTLYTVPPEERTLATVRRRLHDGAAELAAALEASPREYVREVARSLLRREERSRDSILGTAASYLKPWASPVIAKVTGRSDFRLSDLVAGARPMSLYLRLPSDMREEWRPVLKVLIAQATRAMMHHEHHTPDGRNKRHTLLLCVDEFHSFAIPGFGEDLAEMRSYGVQAVLATQSLRTLEGAYGLHETISENCRIKLFMASGDPRTQRAVSEQVGTATEVRSARSRGWRAGEWFGQRGESEAEHTRPVLDTGAVRALPDHEMLLLATGHKPMKVTKLMDFDQRSPFRERLQRPARARPVRDEAPLSVTTDQWEW